jgi:hypothetical protein
MSNLSNGQTDPTKPNTKNATIWAAVVGLVTAGLVFWILGSQSFVIRLIAGVASGVAVAISSYRKSVKAGLKSGAQDGGETK